MTTAPMTSPVVTMHLWGVPTLGVPAAIGRVAVGRRALRRTHGLRFCKVLGTGSEAFRFRDADPHHWGILAVWDDESDARVFEVGSLVAAWDRASTEKARFLLQPISSRGEWSRQRPFEPSSRSSPSGPVAVVTRARIRPRSMRTFGKATPPVAQSARGAAGLRLATGIGEAPIGLQGTFTVWDSNRAMLNFVRGPAHAHVIDETTRIGWYSEELFARFSVLHAQGTFRGRPVELTPDEL